MKLFQCPHQLFDAPCESVKPPNDDDVKQPPASIFHQGIEARPSFFRAAHSVTIDPMRAPSTLRDESTERFFLNLGILVKADLVAVPRPI